MRLNDQKALFYICAVLSFMAFLPLLDAGCGRPYCYSCEEDDESCHIFYGAEGLYWTISQSDLNYAVDYDPTDTDLILGKGKTHFIDYGWTGGFRAWMGWNWGEGWDLKVSYTHYANQAKSITDTHSETLDLKASLLHPDTPQSVAEKATAKIHMEYQTVDAIFGKVICFCDNRAVLTPFFGARGLRLDQSVKALYQGGDFVLTPGQSFIGGDSAEPAQVRWKSDVIAAGLIAGTDMQYQIKSGVGVYGGFAASILASHTDNSHKQKTLDSDGKKLSTEIDLKEKQWLSLPGFNVSAGISWDVCWCGCLYIKLKAGYEFNKWYNVQQIRRYHQGNSGVSSGNNSGHLGLHGAVLSGEIYF